MPRQIPISFLFVNTICMCATMFLPRFHSDLYIHVFLLLLLMMSLFLILSVTLFFTLIAFRPPATLHKHLNCLYLLQDSIHVGVAIRFCHYIDFVSHNDIKYSERITTAYNGAGRPSRIQTHPEKVSQHFLSLFCSFHLRGERI